MRPYIAAIPEEYIVREPGVQLVVVPYAQWLYCSSAGFFGGGLN
jgi:hypothetical protein